MKGKNMIFKDKTFKERKCPYCKSEKSFVWLI